CLIKKIGIIGAGKMGEALIAGFLKSKAFTPQDICASEIVEGRRRYIADTYHIECFEDIGRLVAFSDLIIVAVKPGNIKDVLEGIGKEITPEKSLVSIAAGITLDYLIKYLPKEIPVIRVMPNLACFVREGMMAVCPSEKIPDERLEDVKENLGLLGRVITLEEKYFDAVTGLVGSGPAYIYLVIEALSDAGVKLGLPKDIATTLVAQTVLGAGKMVSETGEHPARLKEMVATPGGTTIEGLIELERGRLRATLIDAVIKATERAKELSKA
ncbi:MAG: pyrroline-5-carboxylate reductase, partial [Candidatus Methylarchaceae archaeon HK02M1]|nr:pyrroline-5-carboxylate reductase [Candidatus Methylarchaceae archaeon HK02M1]